MAGYGYVSLGEGLQLNPGRGCILEGPPDPSAENIYDVNKLLFSPCQYGFSKTNSMGHGAPTVVCNKGVVHCINIMIYFQKERDATDPCALRDSNLLPN